LERSEIIRTLQGLAPNDHVVLFYSNIDTKRELVFPFLQEALQKQGAAVYVTEHEPFDEVRDAMSRWGINVDRHQSDRSLAVADYQALTTAEGRLNELKTSQLLRDIMELLVKRGGPVRVVADPTLLVKRGMVDEIVKRERALGRRLELPFTIVCSYEDTIADTKEGEFLIEMLRTHNHAIFPGIALLLA